MDGKVNCRLFVSDDWFIHATIVHPFSKESDGRVGIYDMKPRLVSFLEGVVELLSEERVKGPFAGALEFSRLKQSEKVAWAFQNDGPIRCAPRGLIETLVPSTLAEEAFQVVLRASRYG